MELIPITTGTLHKGDNLIEHILQNADVESGDILVLSSKVVATVEGAAVKLKDIEVSDAARTWAEKHGRNPAFRQAVLNELQRMNGRIVDEESRYMRSEVRPDGLETGVILTAAAGLDESNIDAGYTIGWPHDPVTSAKKIHEEIFQKTGHKIGVVISDSCLLPRRLGVIAQALVAVGFDPIETQIGQPDLFGKPLRVTNEARADQLATAANYLMGNASQATPAVIIRSHGLPMTNFAEWVPGINPEEDLFQLK